MISQPAIANRPTADSTVVFISYSRKDLHWVKDYLLPLLDAAGIRYIIDERDFEVGPVLEKTIQAKIEEATYVVLVMTPNWVSAKWPHLESVWADDKVWPIKLKPCEIPSHISPRLYLDLSDIRSRDERIVKLLKDVGASETGIAEALNRVAKKTWALLVELMEEPTIQENLCDLQQLFLEIQESNEVLAANKQLHDILQDIQLTLSQCPSQEVEPWTDSEWRGGQRCARALRSKVAVLRSFAESLQNKTMNVRFVRAFDDLPERLREAAQKRDLRSFAEEFDEISTQVERNLPVLNDRIVRHVEDWPVIELEAALLRLYQYVVEYDFDQRTKEALDQFQEGIQSLNRLHQSVRRLVSDHSTLQDADMDFQLMIRTGDPTLYDIQRGWYRVRKWVGRLQIGDRYQRIQEHFDYIAERLDEQETVRDDAFETDIVMAFSDLVDETNIAFHRLDIDLRELCGKLNPHNAELKKILDRMQAYEY